MVPFDMPLDARLALAKMSVIYEREVGSKIRMSRDEDIVSLINFAVDSFNEEIIRYLDTFTKLLAPSELKQLAAQGANIYRGAVVPVENPFTAASFESRESEPVKMYRGQPVKVSAAPTPATPVQAETKAEPTPEATPKPKRIYRGRVIEE